MSSTWVTSHIEFNVTSSYSFLIFSSWNVTYRVRALLWSIATVALLKIWGNVFTRSLGGKFKSSDAKITLRFVSLHSMCVVCSVSQPDKYFPLLPYLETRLHLWPLAQRLRAHLKAPQPLGASHSQNPSHLSERLFFLLSWCSRSSQSSFAMGS